MQFKSLKNYYSYKKHFVLALKIFNCFAINTENVTLTIYLPYNNAYRKKNGKNECST